MGVVIGNAIDVDSDRHLPVALRSPAYGSPSSAPATTATAPGQGAFVGTGSYSRMALVCGPFAPTLPAACMLFAAQWTDAQHLCVLQSVRVNSIVTTAGTSAAQTFDLSMFLLRQFALGFSGSATASPLPFAADAQHVRTGMGQTPWGVAPGSATPGSILYLTSTPSTYGSTSVLLAGMGLSAGIYQQDAQPIARVQGAFPLNPAVGQQVFSTGLSNWSGPVFMYERDDMDVQPIVLAQNEGFFITNPVAGPGNSTQFNVLVQMEWGVLPAL